MDSSDEVIKEIAIRLGWEYYEGEFNATLQTLTRDFDKTHSAPLESRRQAEEHWEKWKKEAEAIYVLARRHLFSLQDKP